MACRSDRVPTDHYGEALATLVAEGAKNPERVAAVIAAAAESIEDSLKVGVGMRVCAATRAKLADAVRQTLHFPEWWE